MKRILLILVLATSSLTFGQLLTESFSGMTASSSLSGQGSWSTNANATNIIVTSGSLSYSGYPSSSGDMVNITTASSLQSISKSFSSSVNSGTVYFSFLIAPITMTSTSTNGDYIVSGVAGSADRPRVLIRKADASNINVGISKDGSTGSTVWSGNVSLNNTHVIVVKYTFNSSTTTDDQVDLFVDPSPITSEPATSTSSTTSGSDASSLSKVQLRQITLAGVNVNIDEIRVGTSWDQAPLPVELTSFTYNVSGSKVNLNWQTATEVNNFGFDIQRKSGNDDWMKVGFVNGSGNSNSPKSYSFTDQPTGGKQFQYRLKQIDLNGDYEYSSIVTAVLENVNQFVLDQNFPNPFNPTTKISYTLPEKANVRLKVYDMLAREIAELVNGEQEAGRYEIAFDGSNLSSGTYFYRLDAGTFTEVKKLILVK